MSTVRYGRRRVSLRRRMLILSTDDNVDGANFSSTAGIGMSTNYETVDVSIVKYIVDRTIDDFRRRNRKWYVD